MTKSESFESSGSTCAENAKLSKELRGKASAAKLFFAIYMARIFNKLLLGAALILILANCAPQAIARTEITPTLEALATAEMDESTQVTPTSKAITIPSHTATAAPTKTPVPRIRNAEAYYEQYKEQGIELRQVEIDGKRYSIVTRDNGVLLVFDKNGKLETISANDWSPDSTPYWFEVNFIVGLYVAENGQAYVAKLDEQGQVVSFLNLEGVTKDNLSEQWINLVDGYPDALWNGKEWTTEIPIKVIAGHTIPISEIGDFKFLTFEEVRNFPTTITNEDIRNPHLGLQFRQKLGSELSEMWVVGEIVGMKKGTYQFSGGDVTQMLEVVIDIPDRKGGIVRVYQQISDLYFQTSIYNLDTMLAGVERLVQAGEDPMKGWDIVELVNNDLTGLGFSGISYLGSARQNLFAENAAIGSPLGIMMLAEGGKYVGEVRSAGKIANKALELLIDPDKNISQNEIDQVMFTSGMIAVPGDSFEKQP